MAFSRHPDSAYEVVRAVKEQSPFPVIAKLSPNVSDIREIALAVEEAGADAVSLINTMLGMAVDVEKKRPVFKRVFAGLSGPAVKPIALRMVYEVYEAVKIPIIGMGGIFGWRDAVEFILAGASAVAVGSAIFSDPAAPLKIIRGLEDYAAKNFQKRISDLVGLAHRNDAEF